MKTLFTLALVSLTFAAPRLALASPGENFETHKASMLAETDERIKQMQDLRTCLTDAKDYPAMKICHDTMRKFHEEKKGDRIENRKGRLQEGVKKLEKKAAKH